MGVVPAASSDVLYLLRTTEVGLRVCCITVSNWGEIALAFCHPTGQTLSRWFSYAPCLIRSLLQLRGQLDNLFTNTLFVRKSLLSPLWAPRDNPYYVTNGTYTCIFFLWVEENLTAHSFKCFHNVHRRSTALLCTDITQGTRLMKQVFSVIKCWWSPANPIPRVLHETCLLHTDQVSRLCCGWRCEILARFKGNPLIKAVCIRSVPPDCLQITQSWAIFIRHAYFLGEWTR